MSTKITPSMPRPGDTLRRKAGTEDVYAAEQGMFEGRLYTVATVDADRDLVSFEGMRFAGRWEVENFDLVSRAAAPEPEVEWKPGTVGTATVRGVKDVRVMRLDWVLQHGEMGERATWVAAVQVPAGGQLLGLHFDDQVSDFVPGEDRPLPTEYDLVAAITDESPLHLGESGLRSAKKAAQRVLALLDGTR